MSTKKNKSGRIITKNSTMFKNNKTTFTGAVKKVINNHTGNVSEANIVADLQAKYPNMYIDGAMVSNVCKELYNNKFFQGLTSNNGNTVYSLYTQGAVKTTVTTSNKKVNIPVSNTSTPVLADINSVINAMPNLKNTLESVLHESTTKATNKYELISNLNTVHLRNICKKELKNWDSKNSSFNEFISTNKYYKELVSRESFKK